ncbi:hypothetical protein HUU59_05830 [bacterium]|nr:hypothetical protein [bacterium]
MRISEALRQLLTADKGLSADQIIDIDFLTEFPIVDDPELKKPMLFYCPSGEWHHVSGIVGKRYRQALQTSDILDDDLGTCRQQIKLFESTYFKDTRASVLDDLRLGRIPLTNFIRYYAYWLFVAIKSSGEHFSYAMVVDDFRIHFDSVLNQYENVLKYLDKKLVVAAAAQDESQVFECIELFQKMVAIPIAVIDESKREGIVKVLKESARIESEIDNRIANELPSAIATLVKAIEDFPNVESHEIPSTYDWIDVSRIETVHSEMVTEYVRVGQAFQTLDNLILDKQSGNLRVSSDKYFDAAFNATLARDVVALKSMAEANATNRSESRFLFPLNMTGWEPNALLPELRKFVSELPFRDSVSHQIALVHLFLPFYVANLQSDRHDLVRTEFVKAANVLRGCLAALPDFNMEQLQSLVVRCETTWQDWDSPIGIAYCLLDNTGKELLLGSTHDAVRLLTTHCGNQREKMLDYLGRSRLHQLYHDSAKKLKAVARNEFAQEHYERYGFIRTTESIKPQSIETKLLREETEEPVVAETLVKPAVDVPEILKMEAYEAILSRNRQESELKFFAEHVPFILKWQNLWDEIVINNRNVANSLIADLLVPANPTSQDFIDRKKVIPDKKTLASVIRDLKLVIPNKEINGHERHMLGRLVVLGLSIELRNIDHVAWLCGFRTKDKPFDESVLPSESNRSTLSRYLHTYGLVFQDLSSPLESSRINKREAVFLKARLASK